MIRRFFPLSSIAVLSAVCSIAQAQELTDVHLSGIRDGQNLSGRVYISAQVPQRPMRVEFYIDGELVSNEKCAPYSLGGDDHQKPYGFDTNNLTDGSHTLTVKIFYPNKTLEKKVWFRSGGSLAAAPTPRPTIAPTRTPVPTARPQQTTAPVRPTATPVRTSTPTPRPTQPPAAPLPGKATPLPLEGSSLLSRSTWESNMKKWGRTHCDDMKRRRPTDEVQLAATYYDAIWVYQQIAEYTGDPSWQSCIDLAISAYRDAYVIPNKGQVPGYWNFTHGLTNHALRTGDTRSKEAVRLLAATASYAADYVPAEWTQGTSTSREVAYAIMSYLNHEKLGAPRRKRLDLLVNQSLNYFNEWFVQKKSGMRPFMVGLTAEALIEYAERTGDPRILPALEQGLSTLWRDTWIVSAQAFGYEKSLGRPATEPSPDLNLLIAPAYAWLYNKTGKLEYLEMADKIFAGGVKNSYLANPKQFNESYRWSFAFMKWRTGK